MTGPVPHLLARAGFAHLPTPLEEAPRLAQALGLRRLLVKREDLCGLSFGGNKTRLMDYVVADALAGGVDTLVAAASVQSNKLREVAAAASRAGMRAVLLLDGEPPAGPPQGNLLLFHLLGAEVRFLGAGRDMLAAQHEVRALLERKGRKVAVLDRRERYGMLATAAYALAGQELAEQLGQQGAHADRVVVTAGAGMTLAGLALGLRWAGCEAGVTGVSIAREAEGLVADILDYARRAAELLGIDTALKPSDFRILGQYAQPGYGIMTPAVIEAIRLVARHHGLVLDPVYNGKTMSALIDQLRNGGIGRHETVVFLDTGGTPALFAYNEAMAEARRGKLPSLESGDDGGVGG